METGNFFKSKRFFAAVFFVILAVGVFLRAYNFEDNLLFGLDQARDWKNAKQAYDGGIGELELLGPRAGGTFFRLGPITTYFQYLPMLVFGDGLAVPSYPDLLFSVLAIPIFYFFSREYFSKKTSLALMALFSVSLFAVEYSRFGWNPNSIPFFVLLFSFALLRFAREDNPVKKTGFLSLTALAMGVLVQLHTITMVAAPVVFIGYLALTKSKIGWKNFLAAAVIFLTLMSPVIVSEFSSGFSNFKAFMDALGEESGTKFGMDKKVVVGAYELSRNYYVILTSRGDIPELSQVKKSSNIFVLAKNNTAKTAYILFALLIIAALAVSFRDIFREYRSLNDIRRKNFLGLFLLSNAVYVAILIFIADSQDTRYYLGLIFTPFVLLGYYFEMMWERSEKMRPFLVGLVAVLVFSGLFQCAKWFDLVEGYAGEERSLKKEYVLEPYFKVTLGQYRAIADRIEGIHRETGGDVLIYSSVYFKRPISHILEYERGVEVSDICKTCRKADADYYYVDDTKDIEGKIADLPSKLADDFYVDSYERFGTLTLFYLKLKGGEDNNYQKNDEQ